MTECYLDKNPGVVLLKVPFDEGLKIFIFCEEHLETPTYFKMKDMAIEEIFLKKDPQKFQSELEKLAQEIVVI